jgi:hypothetical protein
MTERGLAAYFLANRYTGTYNIGDRVFGHWNKIPFIGSVGNDRVINEIEGPRVTVHLDLPIKLSDKIYHVVLVKPQDIKRLKNFD